MKVLLVIFGPTLLNVMQTTSDTYIFDECTWRRSVLLLAGDSATYLFGVIPVVHGSYSSSIIPAMLSTLLLKYVEKLVDRITPEWSKSFLKPLLIVMIVTPITLCAIAPLGLIIEMVCNP